MKTNASDLSFAELMKQENKEKSASSKSRRHTTATAAAVYVKPIPIPNRIKPGLVEYRKTGLQIREFERLKRGKIPTQRDIDLHGCTVRQACDALEDFIVTAHEENVRCVTVICGKGTRSKDGKAVLRDFSRLFLEQHSKVLAFCPALTYHGGDGAIYVLLKARRG